MLNTFEIKDLLIYFGFEFNEEKTHAFGFSHSKLRNQRVYLKVDRKRLADEPKPVKKQPLVVHLDVGQILGFDETRVGKSEPNREYKNDNMSAFRIGASSKAMGIAVNVEDVYALKELLVLMGWRHPQNQNNAEQDIAEATDLPEQETERQAVIAARRGQGMFRASLDEHWKCCAVTGCATRALLRASHIQPWRDSSNINRLNPYNGLLLAAHLDAAFDQGLISFANDGSILIDEYRLPREQAALIGITLGMRLSHVSPAHHPFLDNHRRLHGFV